MSSAESNKMSKKTLSQDSNSEEEIEWDLEDMKRAIIKSAEESWDKYAGG